MNQQYPKLSYGDQNLSNLEPPHLRFLTIGTCQIEPISGAIHALGHVADHVLWGNLDHLEVPQIDPTVTYDATVIGLPLRSVFQDGVLEIFPDIPHQYIEIEPLWVRAVTEGKIEDFLDACKRSLRLRLRETQEIIGSRPTFYISFIEPRRNFLGNLFPRYKIENIAYFVQELNKYIERTISRYQNCYLFDVNEIFSEFGRLRVQDDYTFPISHAAFIHDMGWDIASEDTRMTRLTRMDAMYDAHEHAALVTRAIAQRLVDNVQIIKQPLAIKLIICDLDDTLWRGISGEKGEMGWGETDGWPLAFAEALMIYKARGGMLAICSKNEREPTLEKFKQAFKDGLKIEDFAAVYINYESKAENIRCILGDVNILPQNALFVDDNPREVDEVRKIFPDIHTLSTEPYDWRRKILFSPLTQVANVTDESRQRTQSVQAKIKRDKASQGASREDWLKSLSIEQNYKIVDSVNHENYARAFELLNKTNQFNTTGRRWMEGEMRDFLDSGGRLLCSFLRDKMVDSGLISVFAYKGNEIVQAVLSCRVFGLSSEYATLHYLTEIILGNHPMATGSIVDTGKNFTCHPLFLNAGFTRSDTTENQFITHSITPEPEHILSHTEVLRAIA